MALQELVVFKNEPVLYWLSGKRLFARDRGTAPIAVGVIFFLVLTLPLTVIAMVYGHDTVKTASSGFYISYVENFSWSVSMIILFPLIVGLIYKYYLSIPRVQGHLLESLASGITEDVMREYQ
jgi:hypothetical protein